MTHSSPCVTGTAPEPASLPNQEPHRLQEGNLPGGRLEGLGACSRAFSQIMRKHSLSEVAPAIAESTGD